MSLEFKPLHTPALAVGLALRIDGNDRLLRITHLFKTCAYVMWVRNPEDARYARRPIRISLRQLEDLASSPGTCWGALSLPSTIPESSIPPIRAGTASRFRLAID